jgi:hypothetical protein
MNRTRLIMSWALGLLLVWLTGCDNGYPPIVVNAYKVPVEISITFVGVSQPTAGVLPAGIEVVQRRKGLQIEAITVKEPSGKMREYRLADFEKARSLRTVKIEVWILNEEGLKLGDKEDLRAIQRRRH